jgi:molybdenum cofactor guanylyltransferase
MTNNSIKQNRMKTLSNPLARWLNFNANFDANILGNLGDEARLDRAAWVLTGGRSSRMGTDKARAELQGRAMALRVADAAASVCGRVSLVGAPAVYADLGLPVVPDRFPGEGPLAGIDAALSATKSEANLILACDIPAIGDKLLEQLFAAGGDCAVPRHDDGRLEPLCAVYRQSCHVAVRAAFEAGVRSVIEALRLFEAHGLALRYVRVTDPAEFANLNTPEDWRRYHHG